MEIYHTLHKFLIITENIGVLDIFKKMELRLYQQLDAVQTKEVLNGILMENRVKVLWLIVLCGLKKILKVMILLKKNGAE